MKNLKSFLLTIITVGSTLVCSQNPKVLQGTYSAEYAVGGGSYKTVFIFSDTTYIKKVFFIDEEELIWVCKGTYELSKSKLSRMNRTCEFRRAEEPQDPVGYEDDETSIESVTDSSFLIYLDEKEHATPDTSMWIRFDKQK